MNRVTVQERQDHMASKAKRNHHPDDIRRRRAIQRKKRQRRKKIVRFLVIFVIVTLIAIIGIFYVLNNMGVGQTGPQSSVPAGIPAQGNVVAPTATPVIVETTPRPSDWSDEPATLSEPLSDDQKISVTDLSITESLDSAWQNILLLGNDSRSGEAYGQTDAMMILSIHKETSQVRLTSLSGAMPVSYTHLDVYKRQALHHFIGVSHLLQAPLFALQSFQVV